MLKTEMFSVMVEINGSRTTSTVRATSFATAIDKVLADTDPIVSFPAFLALTQAQQAAVDRNPTKDQKSFSLTL